LFLHHLGALVGEADTDALNRLPLPVLLGWQEYMRMQSGSEPKGLSPAAALEMFSKKYGARNG
jgi:hypothetical protein